MRAGGVCVIVMNDEYMETVASPHLVAGVVGGWEGRDAILGYCSEVVSPKAYISRPSTRFGGGRRGGWLLSHHGDLIPSHPKILKPDITAPGVNVLAAYPANISPSKLPSDERSVNFNVMSGTSMACPHVSGIAGLLKKLHPQWSPPAIRSAIMTTAQTTDNLGMRIRDYALLDATPFSYGAGHVNPNLATDPGLVCEQTTEDYLNFLCNIGCTKTQIAIIAQQTHRCDPDSNLLNFNYPSITIPNLHGQVAISRTVKNVGNSSGTYTAQMLPTPGIDLSVEPTSLEFEKINEEKTFKLTLQAQGDGGTGQHAFGRLTSTDGEHRATSPLVVSVNSRERV